MTRIGLTFDEYADLKIKPPAGADPAFHEAAAMEIEQMFPMKLVVASSHLRSRGYDCRPAMLELLIQNRVVTPTHSDAWSQADVDAAADHFEECGMLTPYSAMCQTLGCSYADFVRPLREAAERESARYGRRVLDDDQLFVMHRQPPRGDIPLLVDHDPGLDNVLGKGEAKVLIGQLHVAGNIVGSTAAAKKVLDLARDGFPLQASVGVAPEETTRVSPGERVEINGRTILAPRNGLTVVAKGKLREVSVVTMGCDSRTSVAIAASKGAGDDDVLTAERVRVASIMKLTVKHPEIAAKAVNEGWDSTKTELEVMRASRPKAPTTWVPATFVANSTVIEASLLTRMGYGKLAEKTLGAEAMERAEGLRANSLVDLCRAALLADQQEIPNNRMEMVKAAISTMSLPTALGDVAHKILLNAYNESPATWKTFCAVTNVSDFRTAKAIRPTFVGELEELPPGGEFKHGTIKEAVTDIQAKTFGKMLGIDRRDIINDDLSLFNGTAEALGKAAMRAISDLVYSTLLANTNSFFGTPHGNYVSGIDSVLSVDSLSRAIALMLAQKDSENRNLDIRPVTLLVPPEQYQMGKMLLESDLIQRAANTPMGNPLKNAVSLEVEPRLSNTARFSGASDKAWYLFATPADAALIVCFLNGVQSPTVEFFGLNSDVNTLAMSWRVYFDYGCGFGDYRAAVLSKGQA